MSAQAVPAEPFPTTGGVRRDGVSADAHPAAVLPAQLDTSRRRAEWLGDRLAEQLEREGLAGLIGDDLAVDRNGQVVKVGESLRGLAQLEGAERDRVAHLAERVARLGLDARRAEQDRRTAATIAAALQNFARGAGLDWADPAVRRMAQAAVLKAGDDQHEAGRQRVLEG